jgi:hypothetical protein
MGHVNLDFHIDCGGDPVVVFVANIGRVEKKLARPSPGIDNPATRFGRVADQVAIRILRGTTTWNFRQMELFCHPLRPPFGVKTYESTGTYAFGALRN